MRPERCEGCVHHTTDNCSVYQDTGEIPCRSAPTCGDFEPDLYCREVQALEAIARLLGDKRRDR